MLTEIKQNQLVKRIQKSFPLVERPARFLAEEIGASESQVLDQLGIWQEEGLLREISAVMEGSALGYDSALVCGRIPADRLEQAAAVIGAHPTVTHLYERSHGYNVWFTIAVPHEMGLEKHLEALARLTDAEYFPLRRTLTFKVGVNFDLKTMANETDVVALKQAGSFSPTEEEKQIIRAAQRPLPIAERPFEVLGQREGVDGTKLLEFLKAHQGGALRRYIGTLRHRKAGVSCNAMTVWRISEEDLPVLGAKLASFPFVSHCYGRTTLHDFPYGLYSMIHGPDAQTVAGMVKEAHGRIGRDHLMLVSPTEFKKCRLRYFLPELEAWDAQVREKCDLDHTEASSLN